MSEETRGKISRARKGQTPWNKGKKNIYSEDTLKKISESKKGVKLSVKHKESITQSLREYYKTNDGPNKGKRRSLEAKQKTSKTLRSVSTYRIETTEKEAKDFCTKVGVILVAVPRSDGMVSKQDWIEVRCTKVKRSGEVCQNIYKTKLNYLEFGAHKTCKSCSSSSSSQENAVADFVTSLGFEPLRNKKPAFMKHSELGRMELDLWIPEKKIAIEYHGLAHHSERPIYGEKDLFKVKSQHEIKYLLCKEKGIQLIQIFEDEWRDKRALCESMIKQRLGIVEHRLFARKCEIKDLSSEERREFFEENHISGDVLASKAFGLFFEGRLVSAVSLRKPWQRKYGNVIEIARFASAKDHLVVGGFSRLLKAVRSWSLAEGYERILTYADCRFGSGKVYLKNGFSHLGKTKPNYFYEREGIRENRFGHRKSLELRGDSEREQQNELDWFAVYDSGNEIYLLDLLTHSLK